MLVNRVRYDLTPVSACDMCGSDRRHDLGVRLDRRTGLRPRRASGVAIPVKRCKDCGLIYPDPMPLPVDIADHYNVDPDTYFDAGHLGEWPAFDNSRLAGLMDVRPGMKAIDVGAGVGVHMRALEKAGWDTWGVEPSQAFVRFGVDRLGIAPSRLLQQRFEDTTLPDDSFDLVSFGAVLEHLPSPARALSAACRILKPGGMIVADIPSSRFLLARLINLYYRLSGTPYVTNISPMHPPFHLYEFTHRSFERNGARIGYEVARHRYWVTTLFNVPEPLEPIVRQALTKSGLGDGLSIVLRKLQ